MRTKFLMPYTYLLLFVFLCCTGCVEDPYDGVVSNEKSIEAVTLGGDFAQIGPATIDRAEGKVMVTVLMQPGTDLSRVSPQIQVSYKANISPSSGEPINFAANNNQATFTVISESGQSRDWVVELVPFTETILGTYDITNLVVYGGTGPEYGGAATMALTDKPWVWPASGGPEAELDNVLTFAFTGVTPEGKTYGTFTNAAGPDGQYANFLFTGKPETDVNKFYRKLPKSEGTWARDYINNTVTFTFADNTTTTAAFVGPGTISLGNGATKKVTDNAFEFTLNGTDDWDNIYSDYDKFVKRPRKFWIDVKKQ